MDDEILKEARASKRERDWHARYQIARTAGEACTALADARLWLEELACLPDLGHEAEHCVGEALRDLRAVRAYLRSNERKAE